MVTVTVMALPAEKMAEAASPSAGAAPSAVTQGMELRQVPCEGLEQGDCSEDASPSGVPARMFAASVGVGVATSVMDAIACSAAGEPVTTAIPGVVHTAPVITIVR